MGSYWIDNTASGAGTVDDIDDPYEDAGDLPAIATGDVFYFRKGQTHTIAASMDATSKGATFTSYGLTGDPDTRPILDAGSAISTIIRFTSVDNDPVVISGLHFQNLSAQANRAAVNFVTAIATDVTVENCVIDGDCPTSCIMFDTMTIDAGVNLAIRDNKMTGTGTTTVNLYFKTCVVNNHPVIDGNWLNNSNADRTNGLQRGVDVLACTGSGSITFTRNDAYDVNRGMRVHSSTVPTYIGGDTLAQANHFANCYDGVAYPSGSGVGVVIDDSSQNVTVRNSLFVENNRGITNQCTSAGTANNNRVIGCVFYANRVNGIDWRDDGTGGVIAHNTVLHKPEILGHGIVIQTANVATECKIINNAVKTITSDSYPTEINTQCINLATPFAACELDGNMYQVVANAAGASAPLGVLRATSAVDLSAWQTACNADATVTGKDANALEGEFDVDDSDFDIIGDLGLDVAIFGGDGVAGLYGGVVGDIGARRSGVGADARTERKAIRVSSGQRVAVPRAWGNE